MFSNIFKYNNTKIIQKYFSTLSYAIVGSGPGGIYTAKHLLKTQGDIKIHFYEKLPHPFGLVRTGVAPDHQDVKKVQNDFTQVLEDKRVSFFGNIAVGEDIQLDILKRNYSAVVLAYGADSDNLLDIDNETASGVYSARAFVNWYNGHILNAETSPFNTIDLKQENVVIIGNGNVAIDVARILCKSYKELKDYDIPESILEKLSHKEVRNIHIVARKEVKFAAFTIKEIKELRRHENVKMHVYKSEVEEVDNLSPNNSVYSADRIHIKKKIDFIKQLNMLDDNQTANNIEGTNIYLRFKLTPLKICASDGKVVGIDFKYDSQIKHINTSLIFKSIGYKSVKLFDEIFFDDNLNIIRNEKGFVYDQNDQILNNVFVVGWVKRGSKGIIDATLRDSYETLYSINEALNSGKLVEREPNLNEIIKSILKDKRIVSYDDWKIINEYEIQEGIKKNKVREKVVTLKQFFDVLDSKKK
jgi:NADPH-dependent glutamate synthase beta subunit-like oxidoreductase